MEINEQKRVERKKKAWDLIKERKKERKNSR